MAEDYTSTKVAVAGQIICELIRKDILPIELRKAGGMKASELADLLGGMYQRIWQAISNAPKAKTQ
ncbi:hypothetical protein ES703_23189 [subsurface metagenome]